jgi:hypothetical protein
VEEKKGCEPENKERAGKRRKGGKEAHLYENDGLADREEVVELDEDLVLVLLVVAICSEVLSIVSMVFLLGVFEIERKRADNEPMKNCLMASRLSSSCLSLISFA